MISENCPLITSIEVLIKFKKQNNKKSCLVFIFLDITTTLR